MKIQNIPDNFVQTWLQINEIENVKTKIINRQNFISVKASGWLVNCYAFNFLMN